ncbi:tripartite tricarboxylate transporter TctB family protein [Marinomonas hwangdonensis]|uniref:Tripartite tricarboxylate transporter TctB family protein n=1 Tax=Marinomonas hwangdonensis TaxID=1053647 RepID=A0A3M8PY83_9GAMM|nr:tripartite tricarboxylate transporter TctB family protein [Marinomonas hwangdonensis]RNF48828.1 tripartite tricarboxylate transporter TctB family protein [Marinomonas hwangdonensis]
MNNNNTNPLLRPMIVIAFCIFIASAAFLIPALELTGRASLLPVAMLIALMVLSVILVITDIKKARTNKTPYKPALQSPGRVLGALLSVLVFVTNVDLLGFYLATAIFVPVAAYLFGCRSLKVLVASDVIVVVGIYLIFGMAMVKDFPMGSIW